MFIVKVGRLVKFAGWLRILSLITLLSLGDPENMVALFKSMSYMRYPEDTYVIKFKILLGSARI